DRNVTGVQTCALPILSPDADRHGGDLRGSLRAGNAVLAAPGPGRLERRPGPRRSDRAHQPGPDVPQRNEVHRTGNRQKRAAPDRSEERRVGKGWRTWW